MNGPLERRLVERIYLVVSQVPRGMVASYGDVAAVVGEGCDARGVGYALNELPKSRQQEIPWQRIINSAGGISTRGRVQRALLEAEGVAFDGRDRDGRDRVNMARFRWPGPDATWAAAYGVNTLPSREPDDGTEQLRLF